jgi:thymidylate synthase
MQGTVTVIEGRNVNELYYHGVNHILNNGTEEQSRLGRVIVAPGPVVSVYERPWERVLFTKHRDANPFFHLMEAIWMLAGEQAAAWPVYFNKQMAEYANHRGTYDGAYGYRWRRLFGKDQIPEVIKELKTNPESRRAVIGMWSPGVDLRADSKDIPCNTTIYFDARGGKLNMTVCNRSNDAVWGAYGANAVHMSVLQEVVAAGVGVPMGVYRQSSNNLHLYPDIPKIQAALENLEIDDRFSEGFPVFPVVKDASCFLQECELFLRYASDTIQYRNEFLYWVARPMYLSWKAHKEGSIADMLSWADQIEDKGWKMSCTEWLTRRYHD